MPRHTFYILILVLVKTVCVSAQTIIPLENDGGVYKVACTVNGLKLKFVFDTGASNVCLSETVASMMLETGYLSVNDILGTSQAQVADGRIVKNTKVLIKKIQIGEITLNNVEAMIVAGESVPLLFGQSAIIKMGRYSITGNKLIIGSGVNSSPKGENKSLTLEERVKISLEADRMYNDGAYSAARDLYKVLYDSNLLGPLQKKYYADCFYYTDNIERALKIYYEIEEDYLAKYPANKEDLFFQIGISLFSLKDYEASIPYLEKTKYYSQPWRIKEETCVRMLAYIYYERGEDFKAKQVLMNYIDRYLAFMEIRATDCWDKCYKDKFLSDLYYSLYLFCSSEEKEKYIMISAAWGNDEAREYCKAEGKTFVSKPYKYEY